MGKFFGFLKYLWVDGYKTVGAVAPLLSISFTLGKYFDVNIEALRTLSYAWALLPLSVWVLVAYVRRYMAFRSLENAATIPPQVLYQNCVIHQYPDGTTVNELPNPTVNKDEATFLCFDPAAGFPIVSSNNVSSLTDSGSGIIDVGFASDQKDDYSVRITSDKSQNYEIYNKKPGGFSVKFDKEPSEKIMLIVEPQK